MSEVGGGQGGGQLPPSPRFWRIRGHHQASAARRITTCPFRFLDFAMCLTLSILNCFSPNFQGLILMKNALNNQVGMLGDMFLWLVANLKQWPFT